MGKADFAMTEFSFCEIIINSMVDQDENHAVEHRYMEMRGVEPLSENPSTPGATIIAAVLDFPQSVSRRQDTDVSSFIKSLPFAKL